MTILDDDLQTPPITQLDLLESEAVHILREVAGEFERPVLLFSGGKDSIVLVHLAVKAFWPGRVPFPLLHVDTGHNFEEVLAFRDRWVAQLGVRLVVATVEESIARGRVADTPGLSRNPLQTVTLLDAIAEHRFDAVFGGARRDEEKSRAKERVFSLRDEFGQWDPRRQRPELWDLYNGRHRPGSTCGCSRCRTGPSSTSGPTSDASAWPFRESISRTPGPCSGGTACGCPTRRTSRAAPASSSNCGPCGTGRWVT